MTKNPCSGLDPRPNPGPFRREWRALITVANEAIVERILRALPPAVDTRRISLAAAASVSSERADQLIFADLADAETLQRPHTRSAMAVSCPIVYLADADSLEARWPDVARLRLSSLFDVELVDDRVVFEAAVAGTLSGLGIDLRSLPGTCDSVASCVIESELQRENAVGKVLERLENTGLAPLKLTHYRLALEEILTNALRYAPAARTPNATDALAAVRSGNVHRVTLTSAVTPELFAISVTDPAGALTADTVRQAISHQLSGTGDLDSGGRGLFIAYSLANLLGITVETGKSTEVVALFRHALPETRKALIINSNADTDGRGSN